MSIKRLKQDLDRAGFEIVHAFPLGALSESGRAALPSPDFCPSCGIIIGNTRTVWRPFLFWLSQQSKWNALPHPFDAFSEHIISQYCQQYFDRAHVLWTHETKDYVVPAQKIAQESGLAFHSAGQFNIHPTFGPWFALRALILLPDTPTPTKSSVQNPSSDAIEKQAHALFQKLYNKIKHANDMNTVQHRWKSWLALRDLYDVGKKYRYTDPQIQYHYTHDKNVLTQELKRIFS